MFLLSTILLIGILTSFTDLKNKKIYNQHLVIGTVLGITATLYAALFKHEHVLFHAENGLIAFLIGFIMHRSALWRGGDAKLFALYAFLMPPPLLNHLLFPGVVSLFACSFIAGMIILFPVFIKDIIINHKTITNELFSPEKREYLFFGIIRIIFYSWIFFPFYYLARITDPVMILTTMYLFFSWRFQTKKEIKKHYINEFLKQFLFVLCMGFISGFLMRLLLSPNSLSPSNLIHYIIMIILSAILSTCIHTTFNHFKDYHERVPFAPLLFIGCILSYTPFLTGLMHLVARWNVLLYH